jgi:hypothetical protein
MALSGQVRITDMVLVVADAFASPGAVAKWPFDERAWGQSPDAAAAIRSSASCAAAPWLGK